MFNDSEKFILRCVGGFDVTADKKFIESSQVLRDVCAYTATDSPITVPIDYNIISRLITYVNACPEIRDETFETRFFTEMNDETLFAFSKGADYLDMEQLHVALGDFIINKLKNMTAIQIGEYLGVRNDYTDQEREEMRNNPTLFYLKKD